MTLQEETPQQNPFEDQRKQALELYEKMVKECHHCSSFIQRAIESYNPDLQAQLSAKEQECEQLKRDIEDQNLKVTRQADHIDVLKEQIKNQTTVFVARIQEIAQLQSDLYHAQSNLEIAGKRCEELEGLLKEWLSQYGWPGKSLTIDTKKLLNQIKS